MERFREIFEAGLELDPNYAVAQEYYAEGYLSAVGATGEAIAELRKAHELDPLSLVIATDLAALVLGCKL